MMYMNSSEQGFNLTSTNNGSAINSISSFIFLAVRAAHANNRVYTLKTDIS